MYFHISSLDLLEAGAALAALKMAYPYIDEAVKKITANIVTNRAKVKDILFFENNEETTEEIEELCKNDENRGPEQLDLPLVEHYAGHNTQLSLFPELDDQHFDSRLKELSKRYKPSPISAIRTKEGKDNAVLLISSYHFDEDKRSPSKPSTFLYALHLRKRLMESFSLKDMRLIALQDATRKDVRAAIDNPNIDHIIVAGHGTWSTWLDADGFHCDNSSINQDEETPIDTFGGHRSGVADKPEIKNCLHPKKSFTRHTCGHPYKSDEYEDQLGFPFAEHVFGRADISDDLDSLYHPLHQVSIEEFMAQREGGRKKESKDERWSTRRKRHLKQQKKLVGSFFGNLLKDIRATLSPKN